MIYRAQDPLFPTTSIGVLLDQLAFACLWIFVMALPWEGRVMIAGLPVTRWLGFIAFGVACARLLAIRRVRRITAVHWLMVAFVCWAGFSVAWTNDLPMTVSRLGSYAQLLLMVWLLWDLARTDNRVASLLYAYCVGTCVSSLQTIHNLITGMAGASEEALRMAGYGRYAPEGFDQNELALMLALGIPMSFYLLGRLRSNTLALLCWVQLALSTTAILLTGSRAGLLSLAAAAAIVPFSILKLSIWRRSLCVALLLVVAVSAVVLIPAPTWHRLLSTWSEAQSGTLDSRTVIWGAGLDVFRLHPFIGVGSGAYAASVVAQIDRPYVAHNSFLSVLVELGVVGALVLLAILAGLFYLAFHMPSHEKRFWTIELMTWVVGVSSLTWEYRKITWLVFGLLIAQAAVAARRWGLVGASSSRVSRNETQFNPAYFEMPPNTRGVFE